MSARVSVVIPVYNYDRFLGEAIESALAQTYTDTDIIVVNDGSKDRSGEIADSFAPRVKVIHKQNAGLSAARNSGINASQSEFIAFLDADDLWDATKLEKQVAAMEANPHVAVCHTDGLFLYNDGHTEPRNPKRVPPPDATALEQIVPANTLFASSAMVRRSVLNEVGLFDESLPHCEDWDLWARMVDRYDFLFIHEPLIRYRVHGASLANAGTAHWYGRVRFFEESILPNWDRIAVRVPAERRNALRAAVQRQFAISLSSYAKHLALDGKRAEALKTHRRAIALSPTVFRLYTRFLKSLLAAKPTKTEVG